ncbi:MAG TPA: monovalent cation/H+ antiporter complex subunit F [Clostridia bacterium]
MLWIMIGLLVLILLVLLRGIIGPKSIDRLISINGITSMVSMIILLMAYRSGDYGLIDIAFVFMICAFAGGLWILRVLTHGNWRLRIPGIKGFEGDKEGADSND